MRKKNRIYILGHKNPDTDSICSAIALAMPGKVLERSLALLSVAISSKLYALPVLLLYPSGFGAGILQSYSSIGNPLSQKQVLFL